ncbi:hypothetical protein JMM59_13390 [Rhodovulum sulfidophilum]|uniref:hypothetical protein n=1 Tax=Rhodovulum sulfidophilum TaxID=35806 RepID=UPI0019219E49|nr:hypothetical protein [Rhodovulum sulfidophilum]MBL3565990.1 hypothetical protein [Rhodovulum sulfidophilum]
MQQPRKFILVPRSDTFGFVKSIPKAVIQNLLKPSGRTSLPQTEKVKEFFSKNRNSPEVEDIQDGSTGYLTPAFQYVVDQIPTGDVKQVVDLGCGNGNFATHIDSSKTEYLGIDLITPPSSSGRTFIAVAIGDNLSVPDMNNGIKLFLCANFLCYVDDPSAPKNFIDRHSSRGDFLAVIDPHGKIWWETFFYGISVFIRKPSEISALFEKDGWMQIQSSGIYLFTVFGAPLFMTTSIQVFRKQ